VGKVLLVEITEKSILLLDEKLEIVYVFLEVLNGNPKKFRIYNNSPYIIC